MGVGAALTAPAGLSIIVTSFPAGPQRGRAIGIYTACGAVGFSAGLIGGGVLSSLGWRWVFGLSVLMAALVWVGAQWIVPRDASMTGPRPSLGLASSVTITGAMLTLVYLIVDVPAAGWASARTLTAAGVFVLLLVAFRMAERSAREPLFASAVLRGGNLVSAALFSAAIMGSCTSFQFISALYLQQNRGWTPWAMAFGFLPLSVLVAIIGPRVGRLIRAVGTRKVIALGFAVYVVAYVQFLRLDDSSPYWSVVLPTVLLIGFAFPLSFRGLRTGGHRRSRPRSEFRLGRCPDRLPDRHGAGARRGHRRDHPGCRHEHGRTGAGARLPARPVHRRGGRGRRPCCSPWRVS